MSVNTVCRVCLAQNTPMRSLANSHLQPIYEKLIGAPLNTAHHPPVACLACYSQLRKCHNIMARAVKANIILQQMLNHGSSINEDAITEASGTSQLTNPLGMTTIEIIDIVDDIHDLENAKIKEESLKSQNTKDIEVDKPINNDNLKGEECIDDLKVEKEDCVVSIDGQGVKDEELDGGADIDNEGCTDNQDIVVKEDMNNKGKQFIDEEDTKGDELCKAKCVKREDGVSEGNECNGTNFLEESKLTHVETQDRTTGELDVAEKWRTRGDRESLNKDTTTHKLNNTKTATNQESRNTSSSDAATNNGDARVGGGDDCSSTNTNVNTCRALIPAIKYSKYLHSKNLFICKDCDNLFSAYSIESMLYGDEYEWKIRHEGKRIKYDGSCCLKTFKEMRNDLKKLTEEKPLDCALCRRNFIYSNNAMYLVLPPELLSSNLDPSIQKTGKVRVEVAHEGFGAIHETSLARVFNYHQI